VTFKVTRGRISNYVRKVLQSAQVLGKVAYVARNAKMTFEVTEDQISKCVREGPRVPRCLENVPKGSKVAYVTLKNG
jgi:hypothetical protein